MLNSTITWLKDRPFWLFILKFVCLLSLFLAAWKIMEYLSPSVIFLDLKLISILVCKTLGLFGQADMILNLDGYYYLSLDNKPLITIAKSCSAMKLIFLFTSFILAKEISRKAIRFISLGTGLIYLFNLIRIILLGIIQHSSPENFSFFHDYMFYILEYGLILALWIIFLKQNQT